MELAFYNLSGGINQSLTKTELGLDTKRMYWTDSKNIELLRNNGLKKQNGNAVYCELPEKEEITGLHQFTHQDEYKLIVTTVSGKVYVYDEKNKSFITVNLVLTGVKSVFKNFLNGFLVMTESDKMRYIKNDGNYTVVDCKLKTTSGSDLTGGIITTYRGRVWVAKGSTIYYSALGTYDNFTEENDAGYINDFHTNTDVITGIAEYKDYLAIYKKNQVYLLSGSSPDDFAIQLFADKGTKAQRSLVNVDNRQFFLSQSGVFSLEEAGVLLQIHVGSEISLKIRPEFDLFDESRFAESVCLHYEKRGQMWYFFPYTDEPYFKTIWINDYVLKLWYKRVVPQNVLGACVFKNNILTYDDEGKIYIEDFGHDFCGKPIDFMWKSPFLALKDAHHRKLIDEFYFVLDCEYDNNFNFCVYKNFDDGFPDDKEIVHNINYEHLLWADEETADYLPCKWAKESARVPIWSINSETLEKVEISESNYAVQICIEGDEAVHNCGIIGLQFREIFDDD
ncbi:MAG: hypothetical protein NC390_01655 [Fusobacterium sp.]|nr:hypothetical protein [Fusobacterium sp.]